MGLQRFPLGGFSGGVNLRDGPIALEKGEAQDARNCNLQFRDVLTERAGKTRFDSGGTFPATKRAEHMRAWYTPGGIKLLMASVDGTVYSVSTAGAFTSRNAGTAGKHWCFEAAQDSGQNDRLWMMNGTDAPKKFDGTTVSAWANTPPNGTIIRLWKNRMLVAGVPGFPQRLFFSDVGNPESPAASYGQNWVDIKQTDDDLDPITWIEVVGDVAIVFKKQSTWSVTDPVSFSNQRLGSPGCEDRFQSCISEGLCYFFCRNGIYSTDGRSSPAYQSLNIEPFFTTLDGSTLSKVRMYATRDRRILCACSTTGGANNMLLEAIPWLRPYSRYRRYLPIPWMFHDLPVSSLCTFRPANDDIIVAGDAGAAKLHRLFDGDSDDGVAISSYWITAWNAIQGEEPYERLRRLNIEMSGACIVEVLQDFNMAPKFTQSISTPADPDPLWDGGTWDGGPWSASDKTQLVRLRPEARGRYHAIKISNHVIPSGPINISATTSVRAFAIYAIEAAVRGGKEH